MQGVSVCERERESEREKKIDVVGRDAVRDAGSE